MHRGVCFFVLILATLGGEHGDVPLVPGIGAVQATPSVRVHLVGSFFSELEPLKDGPRHCGQFSARVAARVRNPAAATMKMRLRWVIAVPNRLKGSRLVRPWTHPAGL
jgi:hypothetical protein